jgi:hypothetical protein
MLLQLCPWQAASATGLIILAVRRPLLVYPDERIQSDRPDTSQKLPQQTLTLNRLSENYLRHTECGPMPGGSRSLRITLTF